jgi:hypothetical protein
MISSAIARPFFFLFLLVLLVLALLLLFISLLFQKSLIIIIFTITFTRITIRRPSYWRAYAIRARGGQHSSSVQQQFIHRCCHRNAQGGLEPPLRSFYRWSSVVVITPVIFILITAVLIGIAAIFIPVGGNQRPCASALSLSLSAGPARPVRVAAEPGRTRRRRRFGGGGGPAASPGLEQFYGRPPAPCYPHPHPSV